jgi:hypothetical protein
MRRRGSEYLALLRRFDEVTMLIQRPRGVETVSSALSSQDYIQRRHRLLMPLLSKRLAMMPRNTKADSFGQRLSLEVARPHRSSFLNDASLSRKMSYSS